MKILAISGSLRAASTNTALLRAIAARATSPMRITLEPGLDTLPLFSPDREGSLTPPEVLAFARRLAEADGVLVSSPEYVHALPGALKNAIDWLVSRDEIVGKPVVLAHASHRGDDMLSDLRRVLSTVTSGFAPDIFLRIPLMKLSPDDIARRCALPGCAAEIDAFLGRFAEFIAARTPERA